MFKIISVILIVVFAGFLGHAFGEQVDKAQGQVNDFNTRLTTSMQGIG